MNTGVLIGVFFLVLAAIYGGAARRDYVVAQHQRTPAGRARFRIAISFAVAGGGLVLWSLISQ